MNKTLIFCTLLIGAILISLGSPSLAQRKGKGKEVMPSPAQVQQEVEYMFIEAEKLYILKNYSQATELLNRCLQLDPENDVVYYKLADINNGTEQYAVAVDYINKALALNSSNKYYYLLAIEIYSNLGDLKKVADNYELLIKQVPNSASYLFNLAAVYIYLKDYDQAIATYKQAEDKFGLSEEISFQRQKVYLEQNKLDEAISEGKRLIEAFPDNPRYVLMTAEILSSNNRLDEASILINDLLEQQPDVSAARLQLADIYWKQNNIDAFSKELNIAFKDPSLNINAKINLLMKYMVYLPNTRLEQILPDLATVITDVHTDDSNSFLIAGDVYTTLIDKNLITPEKIEATRKMAAMYYSRYVAMDQSNYNVWQNLLNLELQLDMQDSLAVHAEQALEVFPNQAWLYLVNGISKQNQGNLKAAVQLLEMGVTRSSGNRGLQLVIYSYLGDLYNELKDYTKSDKAYDRALELDPLNFTVLNNYSYYLSLRGEKLDQAKKMCSTLIKNNPDNTTFLDTYAWVHYNIGEYEEAKRVFEKIMEIGVEEGVYYDHFGDTLYKLGFTQEAIIQWKKAKELDGSIENIDEKINKGKIIQ